MSEGQYRWFMAGIVFLLALFCVSVGTVIGVRYEQTAAQEAEYQANADRWRALGSCNGRRVVRDALTGAYYCAAGELTPVPRQHPYQ